MDADNKYCIMDDADVEITSPVVISEELFEQDSVVEQMVIDKFPQIFKN